MLDVRIKRVAKHYAQYTYIWSHSTVMYCNGGYQMSIKKHYEGVRFNIISLTLGGE